MKKIVLLLVAILATPIAYTMAETNVANKEIMNDEAEADKPEEAEVPKYWTIKNAITFSSEHNVFENWEQGGVSSFSFSAFYRGSYNYKRNKTTWDNSAELGYGLLRQDVSGQGIMHNTNAFLKSDDKIEFNSIYGYKAVKKWNYSGLLNLRSQFYDGMKDDALVTSTLSPAVLTSSLGFEYKPDPSFSALFSFLTGKTTYVMKNELAQPGKFGLTEPNQHFHFSLGSYIKLFYEKDLFKNVHVVSKLEFYYDYKKTTLLDTDINFETMITMKVNKYLSTFLHIQMIMDKDFNSTLQVKERFGISIPITF